MLIIQWRKPEGHELSFCKLLKPFIVLGTWKHTSSIFTSFFVRHQYCSNSYVACYAPIATALMTNKNPAQILDAYLFPSALSDVDRGLTHIVVT